MTKVNIEKMTIREVMEYTKNIPINQGGLSILFEKIVNCIEELQKNENKPT